MDATTFYPQFVRMQAHEHLETVGTFTFAPVNHTDYGHGLLQCKLYRLQAITSAVLDPL
jgi:hypothetical protein